MDAQRILDELEAVESVLGDGAVEISDGDRAMLTGLASGIKTVQAEPLLVAIRRLRDTVDLLLTLPVGYPSTAGPTTVRVSGTEGTSVLTCRSQCVSLTAAVEARVEELFPGGGSDGNGMECMYELVTTLEAALDEPGDGQAMKEDSEPSASISCTAGQAATVSLLIDHMNDSTAYFKKIRGWGGELGLSIRLLYRPRTKPINAVTAGGKVTPRGRVEQVYVALQGQSNDIATFLTRLRTAKLTSQDRREKKSSVIFDTRHDTDSAEFTAFQSGAPSFLALEYNSHAHLEELWRTHFAPHIPTTSIHL